MEKVWFSADHHFGHKNIIDFCGRPWDNVYSMNREMILLWNKTVKDGDRVIYVGDFSLGQHGAAQYLQWLQGVIDPFVLGNHDRRKEWETLAAMLGEHVAAVTNRYTWQTEDGLKIVVTHEPSLAEMQEHPEWLFLFGHIHNSPVSLPPNGWNVGVDVNEFRPISLEEIRKKVGI